MARSRSSKITRPAAEPPSDAWPIPDGCGQLYVDKVHEHDLATPVTVSKFGSAEPRVCTAPLRELTPETSLGFDVIDFADEVLGVTLHPWQRAALIRMLELLPDGQLRFQTVLVLVGRQNGKSTLAQVLTIWLVFVWGWRLTLGTAQDLDIAEQLWSEVVAIVEDDDELAEKVEKVVQVNGKKSLVLKSGRQYKVKAANRRAGRGLSANLVLLDELREHQNWDAWGAITKTTMARAESLILALSNAGDVTSRVLRYLRIVAHRALGDPDGIAAAEEGDGDGPDQFDLDSLEDLQNETAEADDDEFNDDEDSDLELEDLEAQEDFLCILEWSATPGCAKRDRTGWRQANPSLGYGDMTWRKIAGALTDPEWVFRTEVLCQWNDGASAGPFVPGSWSTTTIPTVKDADGHDVIADLASNRIEGYVVAGVAQSSDRGVAYISLAGWRPDGTPQVELVTRRYGTDWVKDWLTDEKRAHRIKALAGQAKASPESTLLKKLHGDNRFSLPILDLQGSDLLDAHADADDAIRDGEVWHPKNAVLDLAAQTAERKILGGGTWVLDPAKSPVEIAPLRSWIAALWALYNFEPEPPPPPPPPASIGPADTEAYAGWSGGMADIATAGF